MGLGNNKISEALLLLGLSIDETFTLDNIKDVFYKITSHGIILSKGVGGGCWSAQGVTLTLRDLFLGSYTISKLPWKPRDGGNVWTFTLSNGTFKLRKLAFNSNMPEHLALFTSGMLFASENDANVFRDRVYNNSKRYYEGFPYTSLEDIYGDKLVAEDVVIDTSVKDFGPICIPEAVEAPCKESPKKTKVIIKTSKR